MVGSRNATAQGASNAEQFARSFSAAGLTIVSGLAQGIDAAAHRGGLAAEGSTIAVLGTGVDNIYPRANAALADEIADARTCCCPSSRLAPRPSRTISRGAIA